MIGYEPGLCRGTTGHWKLRIWNIVKRQPGIDRYEFTNRWETETHIMRDLKQFFLELFIQWNGACGGRGFLDYSVYPLYLYFYLNNS